MTASPNVLDLVASPRRREILRLVWDSERSAGEIHRAMPDVTFGAVSLHLGALSRAGLVTSRAEKRNRYYKAVPEALGPVGSMLQDMWQSALWRLQLLSELEHSRRGPRPVVLLFSDNPAAAAPLRRYGARTLVRGPWAAHAHAHRHITD